MRYEAAYLEAERTADRLQEDYDDPATGSYRNLDTRAQIENLRRTAPALRALWAALRDDDEELAEAIKQAEALETTFDDVWEAEELDPDGRVLGGIAQSHRCVELFAPESADVEAKVAQLVRDFEFEKGEALAVYLNDRRMGVTVPTPDFLAEVKALLGNSPMRRP